MCNHQTCREEKELGKPESPKEDRKGKKNNLHKFENIKCQR